VWPQGTELDDLQGKFQLNNGKLLLNEYNTGTGNLALMGRGSIDLVKRRYQVNANARVDQAVTSANGCTINKRLQNRQIPFVCSGSFDQSNAQGLACTPDERLIRDLLKNSALEKLLNKSGLQPDGADSVKGLINQLFNR
jgi:hypothetical protein